MSEFQCYQFRAIDRPLTEAERGEIGSWSSRAEISSHAATFVYHYGSFRKEPADAVERYFDAMIYFANWGTRQLLLRLPAGALDAKALAPYLLDDGEYESYIRLERRGDYYLLDIYYFDEEGDGWMDVHDFDIDVLAPLRDDILDGDYRALYLAWAKFTQCAEPNVNRSPPPVPPNLQKMTTALTVFANFLEIDEDLLAAAQSASPDKVAPPVDYAQLLQQLPESERLEWLSRLLAGESRLDFTLRKRLEKLIPATPSPALSTLTPAERQALAREKAEARKAELVAAAMATFEKKMQELAGQEEPLWRGIPRLLQQSNDKTYERVTAILKDLRTLAEFQNKQAAFQARMETLRQEYGRRSALMSRWIKAGLVER